LCFLSVRFSYQGKLFWFYPLGFRWIFNASYLKRNLTNPTIGFDGHRHIAPVAGLEMDH
jgi:hypothetical protein